MNARFKHRTDRVRGPVVGAGALVLAGLISLGGPVLADSRQDRVDQGSQIKHLVVIQSQTPLDALTAPGQCGSNPSKVPNGQQARCGPGMRQPLLVVSPFSKSNFVDGTFTTQASVVQLIEDSFLKSQRLGGGSVDATTGSLQNMFDFHGGNNGHPLFLDPATGEAGGG
jgi:hypothetical protein